MTERTAVELRPWGDGTPGRGGRGVPRPPARTGAAGRRAGLRAPADAAGARLARRRLRVRC